MIKVIITGKSKKGQFPYRIEGVGVSEATLPAAWSDAPLLAACRRLKRMGGAALDEYAYLFREGRSEWDARCRVEWGATHYIRGTTGFQYREFEENDPGAQAREP